VSQPGKVDLKREITNFFTLFFGGFLLLNLSFFMSVKDDGVPDEHSAWSTFLFFVEMRYSIFEACVTHCHLAQITEYLEKEFWPLLGIAAL